ncbi:thiopeptide-type bacteriocin biosynthesis protein [Loktanella sp. S4079]|uniref:thiopeptide-type bacteriocin biosynthesis protein n=1 Tax=Loktanella sp. S4079 TaxID=579483 RepID=UPI00069852E3|nr:thiopeptide-type bacteriocin biosynthesis protein [Loktanella sp. S4079]
MPKVNSTSPAVLDNAVSAVQWARLLRKQGLPENHNPEDVQSLEVFIKGGLQALDAQAKRSKWVQIDIGYPSPDVLAKLLKEISSFSSLLLADGRIENMFFMRKSPGLRVRFEASVGADTLRNELDEAAKRWTLDALITHHTFGNYEPEAQLFGGHDSMRFVHSLFTLDSLVWLDWHRQEQRQLDTWKVSFRHLRAVFDGLGISGWEDLGVWAYIVEKTGRSLPGEMFSTPEDQATVTRPILSHWEKTGHDGSNDPEPSLDAVTQCAARWKEGYFQTSEAWIGARQAAAYLTIFHWNRAGLSPAQQALIANALAYRRVGGATELTA